MAWSDAAVKTWLVAISLVVGAMGTEVCYLQKKIANYASIVGEYPPLDDDDIGVVSRTLGSTDIYPPLDSTFSYDLLSYALTIVPNADHTYPTGESMSLALQDAMSSLEYFKVRLLPRVSETNDLMVKCGDEEGLPIAIGADPLNEITATGLTWKFVLTDNGEGQDGSLTVTLQNPPSSIFLNGDVILTSGCMDTLREKKNGNVVKVVIAQATKLQIVLGTEPDSLPKVDGAVFITNKGLVPVIDYSHFATLTIGAALQTSGYVSQGCVDLTHYLWTANTGERTLQGTCLLGRTSPCKFPIDPTAGADDFCSSDYCSSCNDGCVASPHIVCALAEKLFDLVSSSKTTRVMVGDVEVEEGNLDQFNNLYLGERLTLSCKDSDNHLIEYNKDLETRKSYSEVSIDCLMNSDGEITDFSKMVGLCQQKCTIMTFDSSVKLLDIDFDNNVYPHGYPVTISCQEGYGNQYGYTDGVYDVKCVDNADISAKKCYGCALPTLGETVHGSYVVSVTDSSAITKDRIIPTATVTLECESGYSLQSPTYSARWNIDSLCEQQGSDEAYLSPDITTINCIEDCPLNIMGSGLSFVFDGYTTYIDSVPQGKTYTLSCDDNNKLLPYGQDEEITCTTDTNGDVQTIYVSGCEDACNVDELDTASRKPYRKSWPAPDPDVYKYSSDTDLPYGTPISLKCAESNGYAFDLDADNSLTEFLCDDSVTFSNVNYCYERCELIGATVQYADNPVEVIKGDDTMKDTKITMLKMRPGSAVRVKCKESDTTVGGTTDNYIDITCTAGEGDISLTPCRPSCLLSDVQTPTTNTKVSHLTEDSATRIPYNQEAKISCTSDQYRLSTGLLSYDKEYLKCGTKDAAGVFKFLESGQTSYALIDGDPVLPTTYSCIPLPEFPANQKTATGPKEMTITVTLPSDRDAKLEIEYIEIKGTVTTLGEVKSLCRITDTALPATTFSCVYTESDNANLAGGVTDIKALVSYTQPAIGAVDIYEHNKLDSAFAGPPRVSDGWITVSAIGAKTVEVNLVGSNLEDTFGPLNIDSYPLRFEVSLTLLNDNVVITEDAVDYSTFMDKKSYNWDSNLEPMTQYKFLIKTYLQGNTDGGVVSQTFPTGRSPPTVEVSRTSSTTNTITITDSTSAASGQISVKYEVTTDTGPVKEASPDLQFTDGKATIDLTELQALTKYTFTVTLFAYSLKVPSEQVSYDFVQGPDQPEIAEGLSKTHDAITVTWTQIIGYKYYLKVFEKQADSENYGTDPVEEYVYTATESSTEDRKKREVQTGSHTFESLKRHGSYKLTMIAETEFDGQTLQSTPAVERIFQLYACSKADKTADGSTIEHVTGEEAVPDYLEPDPNTVFVITCQETSEFVQDAGGEVDTKTTCEENGWSAHSLCEPIPDEPEKVSTSSTGILAGIVVAVFVVIIVIIGIIIVIIKRRRGNENTGSTKKYSPRDEEKQNEISGDGGEAWRNPYYRDTEEKAAPDIPANGDNVSMASQEKKIHLNDDDDNPDVVIDNKAAVATEQV